MPAGIQEVGSNLLLQGYLDMNNNPILLGLSDDAYIQTTVIGSSLAIANDAGTLTIQSSTEIILSAPETVISNDLVFNSTPTLNNTEDDILILLPDGSVGRRSATSLGGAVTVDGITIDYNTAGELEVIDGGSIDLQGAYDNSGTGTKILTDVTNGSLSVQEGTGLANTINIYQGLNEAGSTTFYVDGNGKVGATSIQLDLTASVIVTEGQIAWNANSNTIDVGMTGGNVTLQVGQETLMHVKADEAISIGDVVYASGAVGLSSKVSVSKYLADGSIKAYLILGIATEAIASGQLGYIATFGTVRSLDTTGGSLTSPETWNIGDILYPSPFNVGELTNIIPISPNIAMPIGFVVNVHASNGSIITRLTPPNELSELHDVHVTSPTEGQILQWNDAQGHWNNEDFIPIVDGITIDVNTAGELEVIGGSTSRTWTWSGSSNSDNVTDSYLFVDNVSSNLSSYIVPFNSKITAISASTNGNETWTAEIRINGSVAASVNITGTSSGFTNGLSIPFNAGDKIEFYCTGTNITKPIISGWFEEI